MTAPSDEPILDGIRIEVWAWADGTVSVRWTFPCGHTADVCDEAGKVRAMAEMILRHCMAAEAAAGAAAEGLLEMRLPVAGSA